MRHNHILVLLSSAKFTQPEVGQFLRRYSEGVGDVAFRVQDLDTLVAHIQKVGERLLHPIQSLVTAAGKLRWCRIRGWGSVYHTLIEHSETSAWGTDALAPSVTAADTSLAWRCVDHAVLNVPSGELSKAADWYVQVLGFTPQQQFVIETPRSGLRSIVLKHPEGEATLPINEPTSVNSQVQEFIQQHRSAGIQHIALQSHDLVGTIAQLRQRGLAFLSVPEMYYRQLRQRSGFWQEAGDWDAIAQQQILVDWPSTDPYTRLLQTFTQPLFDQPTFFWEFIERQPCGRQPGMKQAEGFGEGNFQALFEAIEREQQLRGSLE